MASEEGAKLWSSRTNLLSTYAAVEENTSSEPVLRTVYDAFSKEKVVYRKDVVTLSGEYLQKYRQVLQWMAFLKPEERTVEKSIQYFEKEFESVK
jgi:hypothetical protein